MHKGGLERPVGLLQVSERGEGVAAALGARRGGGGIHGRFGGADEARQLLSGGARERRAARRPGLGYVASGLGGGGFYAPAGLRRSLPTRPTASSNA